MLKEHFMQELGYRLSDAQIDILLHIDENKNQPGYVRFNRGFSMSGEYTHAP